MNIFKKKLNNNKEKLGNPKNQDSIVKTISLVTSSLVGIIFLALVGYIFTFAIIGFVNFGIENILFTDEFNPSNGQYSFWIPFFTTVLSSTIALFVAVPIGIRVAIFAKYRIRSQKQENIF